MIKKIMLLAAFAFSATANADLTPWADYEPSKEVLSISTIKVKSNMGDAYLEGIANTWVEGNEAAMKVGQIEDYWIYRSDLPDSGDFNLLLVVKFADTEALAPSKARYDAFMKEFTQKRSDESTEFAQKNYPAMREITGQYIMREIKLKK